MTILLLALLIGIVAGLRAMTAPAAVALAAVYGPLVLTGTPLAFLAIAPVAWVLVVLALGELVTDQLPSTPSRTVPVQFGARIIMGAIAGAGIGAAAGGAVGGAVAGAIGAVIGTFAGAAARARLAASFGRDRPAALIEDAVAIVGGLLIAWAA
ncbi:DUF4126 domain-containing protein [Sphingomonas sp.]|uniref:DUF4126 domain-containing protein n=1 Tax=Sphingomonas sp. TaxID=28214 RepID=UPI003B3B6054